METDRKHDESLYSHIDNCSIKEYTQEKIEAILMNQTQEDLLYCDDKWFYETVVNGNSNIHEVLNSENKTLIIYSPFANEKSRFKHPYPGPNNNLTDFINYINEKNIRKVKIKSEDLSFLNSVQGLDYVEVIPPDGTKKMDFSPLYGRDYIELTCANYEEFGQHVCGEINLDQINSVEYLYIKNKGDLILNRAIPGIKKISISSARLRNRNLDSISMSTSIEAVRLFHSNIESLDGIEKMYNLRGLKLLWNHKLTDINALAKCADNLQVLWIENCSKIADFSCLYKLKNIEWLWLHGNNEIPDFEFIKEMPKLKRFAFTFHVKSGDISPCFSLPSVSCRINRKEYHLNGRKLPNKKTGDLDDFWRL